MRDGRRERGEKKRGRGCLSALLSRVLTLLVTVYITPEFIMTTKDSEYTAKTKLLF